MKKSEFVKVLTEKASEYGEVAVQQISRVNVNYLGLYVKRDNVPTPVVNLDKLYAHYCEHNNNIEYYFQELEDVLSIDVPFDFSSIDVANWEWVKDHLYFRLMGHVVNGICRPVADLYLVPYIHITDDDSAAVRVTAELIDSWGVTVDEVFDQAKANQETLRPVSIKNLATVLGIREKLPIYIVTTKSKVSGASAILYSGVADRVRELIGGDFYIIPSSVHEVLVLPKSEINDVSGLIDLVVRVNQEEVAEDDRLSDSIYTYDFEAETLKRLSA